MAIAMFHPPSSYSNSKSDLVQELMLFPQCLYLENDILVGQVPIKVVHTMEKWLGHFHQMKLKLHQSCLDLQGIIRKSCFAFILLISRSFSFSDRDCTGFFKMFM